MPNTDQAKHDDWPKESWKKCPIKAIQTTTRAQLSLSLTVWPSACTLFPPNKYFTVSLLVSVFVGIYFCKAVQARALSLAHWFLVGCVCVCVCVLVAQLCPALCDPMDCSPPGPSPWNSPGKNIGVGSHSLLQGIFLTQELNPGLLHCR